MVFCIANSDVLQHSLQRLLPLLVLLCVLGQLLCIIHEGHDDIANEHDISHERSKTASISRVSCRQRQRRGYIDEAERGGYR